MTERETLTVDFLRGCGWEQAERRALAGDASARRYERLILGNKTAILMDAPREAGEDTATFSRIARHLSGLGLSSPIVMNEDNRHGFLLLEDLGDDLFARLLTDDPSVEAALYEAAVDVLVRLQAAPACADLPDLSAAGWAEAACFAIDWYRFATIGDRNGRECLEKVLTDLIAKHADGPRVMVLRDYHAENLLWLADRKGRARVGLLDFQLAQFGQPCYDLVSLCQDARRDVSPATEQRMIAHFRNANGLDETEFGAAYATFGAQRALRILGVFCRLSLVSGKPGYVSLIPRVWSQLRLNLRHPALAELSEICAEFLPDPTGHMLERIRSKCASQKP